MIKWSWRSKFLCFIFLGTWFLPPTTMLGAGLYSVALYGGLVVFGGFLLFDTQRVMRTAEMHPVYAARPYDPINA